jgi:hypothetical protein
MDLPVSLVIGPEVTVVVIAAAVGSISGAIVELVVVLFVSVAAIWTQEEKVYQSMRMVSELSHQRVDNESCNRVVQ